MTRVGINGFGRIGRNIYRAADALKASFEIVAVNDIGDAHTFAHLLKHDTALGTFGPPVAVEGDDIVVGGRHVKFMSQKDPAELPWKDLGVDIVVESTGLFTDATKARVHIDKGGAKKVIISAPATNQDFTVVMGVNHKAYDPKQHNVISNASCTTNTGARTAQQLRHRARNDDDDSCIYRGPEAAGPPTQGPAPRSGGGGQHHPDLNRRQPGGVGSSA